VIVSGYAYSRTIRWATGFLWFSYKLTCEEM